MTVKPDMAGLLPTNSGRQSTARAAIFRKKQIKGWRREKKMALVEGRNKEWKDLSAGWYKLCELTPLIPRGASEL